MARLRKVNDGFITMLTVLPENTVSSVFNPAPVFVFSINVVPYPPAGTAL